MFQYVVYADSNPANVLAIFFNANGSQDAQAEANAYVTAKGIPGLTVAKCTDSSYALVSETVVTPLN